MMSELGSLAELARRLNISPPKAKRMRELGIFTPSGRNAKGELFNLAFVDMWRQAMAMSHNPPKQ
jgi:hypothetical protein